MAQELAPILPYALVLFGAPILPALLISVFFGGRAVFYTWLALCLVGVGYLVWFALFGSFSTGMEGIAFVILPICLAAIGLGSLVGSAIGRILRRI